MNERAERTVSNPDLRDVPCFNEDMVARMRSEMPSDETLEEGHWLLMSIADKSRLRLLYALRKGEELCAGDVAHVLGISVSVASHHLLKLRGLRVLEDRSDGKMTYYSLRNPLAG
jgi:DNA-binding transcriptional ArsR family regulator